MQTRNRAQSLGARRSIEHLCVSLARPELLSATVELNTPAHSYQPREFFQIVSLRPESVWIIHASFFVVLILKYIILIRLMCDSLPALLESRNHLLRKLSQLGDFQSGSISTVYRRCGRPNCHCARPDDRGHGPHRQLTQKIAGKTVTQNLSSPIAVRKAEKEIAEFRRFQTLTRELVEVNQEICRWHSLAKQPGPTRKRRKQLRKSVGN